MTRINSNIPPEELHTVHLLAEWRELPRVFVLSKKAEDKGFSSDDDLVRLNLAKKYDIPEKFCLGKGHVRFFMNKLQFLSYRFSLICYELELRGVNISHKTINQDNTPRNIYWYQQWVATEESKILVRERILERVAANRKKYNFPDDVELNQETWAAHVKKDREQRIRVKM